MFKWPKRHPIREDLVINSTTGTADAMLDTLDFVVEAIRDMQWLLVTLMGSDGTDGVFASSRLNGVEAGLVEATGPETLTVTIKAGVFVVDDLPFRVVADHTTAVFEVPVSEDRIDLVLAAAKGCDDAITVDSFVVIEGDENDPPVAPAVPEGMVLLAEIYCRPGMTVIKDTDVSPNDEGYITDSRHMINV